MWQNTQSQNQRIILCSSFSHVSDSYTHATGDTHPSASLSEYFAYFHDYYKVKSVSTFQRMLSFTGEGERLLCLPERAREWACPSLRSYWPKLSLLWGWKRERERGKAREKEREEGKSDYRERMRKRVWKKRDQMREDKRTHGERGERERKTDNCEKWEGENVWGREHL